MKKIYDLLCKLETIICGIFLILVVVLVFLSALTRKFNIPMQKSLDVAQLLFAWLAFIGADIALRQEKLVGVDIITSKLSKKANGICRIISHLLMIALLVVFVIKGFDLTMNSWDRSFQSLKLSYACVTMSLPVGSLLMILSTLTLIAKDIRMIRGEN